MSGFAPTPITIQLPQQPSVTVSDGVVANTFSDRFTFNDGVSLSPIEQAAPVARLRALADQIEKASAV